MSGPDPLDTIVAPATPPGRSALAIIRIDGPRASEVFQSMAGEVLPEARNATLVRLRHADADLDDCIAVRYEAPHSFTGNDLVELTLHGNPLLIERVITAAREAGARIAEPGEFTERAVLNGKLDLVQAESVADLIAARTTVQARLSLDNLHGTLSRVASSVRASLLHVIARLEAALDFSDEGYDFIDRDEALQRVREASGACAELADTFIRGRAASRGLSAVILGRPNAGKSSLLNRLVGSDRAIVTPLPGTTRDVIRETIEIGGLPVTLSDTAGLRESDNLVESIGVDRARAAASEADLILYLIDAESGASAEDRAEIDSLTGRHVLIVYTKIDVAAAPAGELGISVNAESGMKGLLTLLDERVRDRFAPPEGSVTIVNERQLAAVEECAAALTDAARALEDGAPEQMVLVDLQRAARALGMLTGEIAHGDVLAEIFSRFCIGK